MVKIKPTYEDLEQRIRVLEEASAKGGQDRPALSESENKYRHVVENLREGIAIVQDLKLVFVNRAALALSGYSEEAFMSRPFLDFIHPDDRNKLVQNYFRRLAGEEVFPVYTLRVLSPDGDVRYAELRAETISWAEKPAVLAFFNDITERKRMEEELRKSEERYSTILEDIDEGYYEEDLAGTLTFVNDALARHLGYTKEELIGINYRQLSDEAFAKKMKDLFGRLYETGEPFKNFEAVFVGRDGDQRIAEFSGALIRDRDGKPAGFRGVSHDITERKKMETELRRSEEKYRTIIDAIEDGYVEVDLTGHWTFVNDVICKHMLYLREELLRMDFHMLHTQQSAKKTFQAFVEVFNSGRPLKALEVEAVRKDGSIGNYELSVSLMTDEKGQRIGFRCISRDISERKRVEKERDKLIERLQKALSDVKTLSGLLPICSSCKKIRNDKGYWEQIEEYIGEHSKAQFSHGICPECVKKLYPDIYEEES